MSYERLPLVGAHETHDDVTAYINAGGRGTRLSSVLVPHPDFGVIKALLEVGEPPVTLIDHHVAKMAQAALRNIVISAGDVSAVKEHAHERYSENDQISVTTSPTRRGNGGDLLSDITTHPELFADRILITNVDTILDMDVPDFLTFQGDMSAPVSISLTRRKDVPNQGAFYVDQQNKVLYSSESGTGLFAKKQAARKAAWRGSSTGAVIVETAFIKDIAKRFTDIEEASLYRHVVGEALQDGAVSAYDNGYKFFMDLGTVSTWLAAQDPDVLRPHLSAQIK